MTSRLLRTWGPACIGVLALTACFTAPSFDRQTPDTESSLELFSWWTQPGETEALGALLEVFEREHPEVYVTNAAAENADLARSRLATRLDGGEPPDSFQAISGSDLLFWVEQGKMAPLDELSSAQNYDQVFPEVLLETLSSDGKLYAIPANIERDNNLYYAVDVLKKAGVEAPETIEEFFEVCQKLEADESGPVPLALPAAGWVMALVAFESLMPGLLGANYYREFFSGEADLEGPELTQLFEEFDRVLDCSNVDARITSWAAHADLLYEGDAAMLIMGDWAKGYWEGGEDASQGEREPWVAERDFDVVAGLGSGDFFVFNSAVFGLPQGAIHPRAASAFLEVLGSKEGQEAFNPVKGSVPARTDVDWELFDNMTRRAGDAFLQASQDDRLLPGYASLTTYDFQAEVNSSLLVFALGGKTASELDPQVSDSDLEVSARDVEYIVKKLQLKYSLLKD